MDKCPTCKGIWLDDGEAAALMIAQGHVRANVGLYLRLGN
jgi:Zn-finger nucleic acid-binding protein